MTYVLDRKTKDLLGFDLDQAIADYKQAKAAHASTVGVPAPTAHPLVAYLTDTFGGEYELEPLPPEPEPAPAPPAYTPTRIYKGNIWRRATDAEAVVIDQVLNAQPVRLRRLWQDSTYLDKNDDFFPLIETAFIQAFGAGRAADLLLATE